MKFRGTCLKSRIWLVSVADLFSTYHIMLQNQLGQQQLHGYTEWSLKYGKVTSSLYIWGDSTWSERRQSRLQRVLGAGQHPFVTCRLQHAEPSLFALELQPLGDEPARGWQSALSHIRCWVWVLVPPGNALTSFSKVSVLSQGYSLGPVPKSHWILALVSRIFDEVITLLH